MLRKLFTCWLLLVFSSLLIAEEKVVLQLKWEHQFQFAGYYAAKWQGFYEEAGLDVEIRPSVKADKSIITPSDEIKQGQAQFAIGGLDILLVKDNDLNPVILASLFQHSPTAIFSLQHTDISSLRKLSQLRIAVTESDFAKAEIAAMFRSHGYDFKKIKFVDQPVTIDTLLNNEADAIVTYAISAEFSAKEKSIKLNKVKPADLGLDFYGDSLYTSFEYANSHPDIVNQFTKASMKGWRYAIEHKEEIAKRIANEFPRYLVKYDDIYQYNLFFAEHIDQLLNYAEKPLGDINKERWFNMNERIRSLGLLRSDLNDSHFSVQKEEITPFSDSFIFYLLSIIMLLFVIFFLWTRELKVLTLLAVILVIVLFEMQFEDIFIKEEKRAVKENATQVINTISAKLQGELQNNLSLLTGFASYISATPELTNEDFARYAQPLFQKDPMLISFAAAKDLVINYVFPLKGNEKAMGLNYRNTPDQIEMVEQLVNTGQVQMIGPVNLVQGGKAFIGRAPVFLPDGTLWGIISAPIDADLLLKFIEKESSRHHFNIAIRSYDLQGEAGPVFFGESAVFDAQNKLASSRIAVGGHSWHIAATPLFVDNELPTNIYLLRSYFIVSAFIFSLFIWFRFKQTSKQTMLELKLNEDKRLLESVGRVAKIGGWELDNELNFIKWSEQSSLVIGEPQAFLPAKLSDLKKYISAEDYQLWKTKIKNGLKAPKAFSIKIAFATKNNKPMWLKIVSDGKATDNSSSIIGTIQDISEKILNIKFIEYQASHDSLTNLPNRRTFQDRLDLAIESASRSKKSIAILFIDLDRFKPINDNLGHHAGDLVLIESADRLKKLIRSSDTVSRISGDEFALILNDVEHYKHALTIADKISQKMQEPYQLSNAEVHLSASIGIAIYPDDANNADELLKKADQAMYEVKANGRNGYQFYTQEMQQKSEYRHQLRNELITALKTKEIQPYFQPIIELNTKQIRKCETLARWQQKNGDFIAPIEFINLAEETGLINQIDLFMLEESSKYLMEMDVEIELSINVSPRLFHTKDNALQHWLTAIKKISKSVSLTIEITERLLTEDSKKVLTILNQCKNMGIKVAIDDFGTGYSSLNYLINFPIDQIKIDRSFIKNIGIDSASEILIETILTMANRLGIKVVAEGIETQEQLTYLHKHHCDFGQGYLLGKPMNRESFHSLLKK